MIDHTQIRSVNSRDDILVALLLGIGLFFPTSIGRESRQYLVGIAFVLLLCLVVLFLWKRGARPGAVTYVSLPILIVLSACTMISHNLRFGWGVLFEYGVLAAVFALNLREVRPGPITRAVFFFVNVCWIACGVAILIGNERVSDFLVSWYSQFSSELLPQMIDLHKPVFTFGTHSFAGLFTYLFFWLNWERYKVRYDRAGLVFALCQFILLIAISSYTSLSLAVVATLQIGVWLWKRSRRALLVGIACIGLILFLTRGLVAEQIEIFRQNPEVAAFVLNPETNGLLVRYGTGGVLYVNLEYIKEHPFAPIGFTFPSSSLFLSDSGPIEYLLRGSIPLLLLIYAGVYRFLVFNSPRRIYALYLFFFLLAFEVGLGALPYFRTQFLLPFVCVYLNELCPTGLDKPGGPYAS